MSARNIASTNINLTGSNLLVTNLTGVNFTATNLLVTNLTALSSILNVVDITQYEISGFNVQGDANVNGNVNVTGNLSALNITLTDNGSLVGATSATTINIGGLSARTFDLVHTPANDGVDPIFNIGESTTEGFSGLRVRYDESINDIFITSRTGSTVLTSAVIDIRTGAVGISGMPAPGQALTVSGNISASGIIIAANTPSYYYLDNNRSPISGSFIPPLSFTTFFEPSATLLLLPNKVYELQYSLFFTRNTNNGFASFALSSTPPLNHISLVANTILGYPGTGTNTSSFALPLTAYTTSTISATPGSFVSILSTNTLVPNVSHYVNITTFIQTSATSNPFTSLNIQISSGSFGIIPLKGSLRKITLIN